MLDLELLRELDYGGGNSCSAEEYTFLGALVLLTGAERVLEIGTSTGIGAYAMAAAGNSFGRRCQVTTLDIPFGSRTFAPGLSRNRELIERARPDLPRNVEFLVGRSHDLLPMLAAQGRTFDLIFIDGDHAEEAVEIDWQQALALKPALIVLHDTIHHAAVARVVQRLRATYDLVTLAYPPGHAGGTVIEEVGFPPTGPGSWQLAADCPGMTLFIDPARARRDVERYQRDAAESGHETAQRLADTGTLTGAQVRDLFRAFRFTDPCGAESSDGGPRLEVVLTGRNDGYGGEDFIERLLAATAFNHRALTEAGISHAFTLVEWNPPPDRPLLGEIVRQHLPWWDRCYVVDPAWHARLSANPRLQFMEFFAKNVAIRRSRADWILTTNSDIFLSAEVVARLAANQLTPGTLYRAERVDVHRQVDWRNAAWDAFSTPAVHLRHHRLEPPYFTNAAGDFLLLDRRSCHRVGGFNEIVRFAKIYKDGQFCIQCHHLGLAIEVLGSVYHLDHDGSFVTAREQYGAEHREAPFGPWWDASRPYENRPDWGLRAAVEFEDERRLVHLSPPETAGPTLSFVIDGTIPPPALGWSLERLLQAGPNHEIVVVDPPRTGEIEAVLRNSQVRAVRTQGESTAVGRLNVGLAFARGRLLCCLSQPASFSAADLARILEGLASSPDVDVISPSARWRLLDGSVLAGEWTPAGTVRAMDRPGPFSIFKRHLYDRHGGFDERSSRPQIDYWAAREGGCRWRREASLMVDVLLPGPADMSLHSVVDEAWTDLVRWSQDPPASGALVPVAAVRDQQRRSALLHRVLQTRLRNGVAGVGSIGLWGLDVTTRLVLEAAHAEGIQVDAIYSGDPQWHGDRYFDVSIRPLGEVGAEGLIIVTSSDFAERVELYRLVSPERIVHLFEPRSEVMPPALGFMGMTPLIAARRLKEAGDGEGALEMYRAMLEGQRSVQVNREAAELATMIGKVNLAQQLYRRLVRLAPEDPLFRYRLASVCKQRGALEGARRHFRRVLAMQPDRADLVGGSHFHLGEILLAGGHLDEAALHFEATLVSIPDHGRARQHLERCRPSSGPAQGSRELVSRTDVTDSANVRTVGLR